HRLDGPQHPGDPVARRDGQQPHPRGDRPGAGPRLPARGEGEAAAAGGPPLRHRRPGERLGVEDLPGVLRPECVQRPLAPGEPARRASRQAVMATGHVGAECGEYALRYRNGLSPVQPLSLDNELDAIRRGEPDLSVYDALPHKTLDPGPPPETEP